MFRQESREIVDPSPILRRTAIGRTGRNLNDTFYRDRREILRRILRANVHECHFAHDSRVSLAVKMLYMLVSPARTARRNRASWPPIARPWPMLSRRAPRRSRRRYPSPVWLRPRQAPVHPPRPPRSSIVARNSPIPWSNRYPSLEGWSIHHRGSIRLPVTILSSSSRSPVFPLSCRPDLARRIPEKSRRITHDLFLRFAGRLELFARITQKRSVGMGRF